MNCAGTSARECFNVLGDKGWWVHKDTIMEARQGCTKELWYMNKEILTLQLVLCPLMSSPLCIAQGGGVGEVKREWFPKKHFPPFFKSRERTRQSDFATLSTSVMHEACKMEWPSQPVSEEVDERPWASLGSPSEAAGMSLNLSDHPWHADDVESEPLSSHAIPARQRLHHPRPRPIGRSNNTTTTTIRANLPTPVRLLWPAGPLPLASPPPITLDNTSWHSQATQQERQSSGPDYSQAFLPTRASTRTAHLELLVSTRRTMDYVNDAAEHARASYNVAAQTAGSVWRALTSKTAQRTLVTTVLFSLVSAALFAVACVGYLAFYHNYLPDQVVSLPVHLQYGYVTCFLFRVLSILEIILMAPATPPTPMASSPLPTHTLQPTKTTISH